MSILDGIMKPIAGCPDDIGSVSAKAALDPAMTEKAVMALARSHVSSGRTADLIEQGNGLAAGVLSAICARIGGDASLRRITTIELAAAQTGMASSQLEAVYDNLGGDAALSAIASGLCGGLGELAKGDIREDLALFFPAFFKQPA